MNGTEEKPKFRTWAVIELMGHRRLGGLVSDEELFGVRVIRIDVPTGPETFITQYYATGSMYAITPCAEEAARAVAACNRPVVVHRWELPASTTEGVSTPSVDLEF